MERSFGMSSRLDFTVEVKDLQELTVACVRHIGPYNGIGKAFEAFGRWAGPRGLFALPGAKTLAVYHDSPGVSEPEKLRSSACLVVPEGTEVTDGVSLMKILGGKYAVARFEIAMDQFGAAWDTLMSEWFPSSGWQPEDRMCYEVYLNDPGKHPEGKFVIDICEPVRPA
jgi:AraC family transcriptional regulator